jgi:hypothetical protein
MIGGLFGVALTWWSAVRSSKWAMYATVVAVAVLAVWYYLAARDKRVAAEVIARGVKAATKRMERNREIHRDIQTWPLDKRAQRLRDLSARR